jgi:hypothetical protein
VVCPRCAERATARPAGDDGARRLSCPSCGLAKETMGDTSTWGGPVDPWFGEPLWLRAEFRGQPLWAYNARHLAELRAYVAAAHRERTPAQGAAMSMLEKLPSWMTSAKHRDDLVAALEKMATRA